MTENLGVVYEQTTDRIRTLWRNCRLSKQAKDFLSFLIEKNIDGTKYSKLLGPLDVPDVFPYDTEYNNSGSVDGKWKLGPKTHIYSRAISLSGYVTANRDKFPNAKLHFLFSSGENEVYSTVRNSLNRTIQRLWRWRLLERYYIPSFCGSKHFYFITEKGKQVYQAKCCSRRMQQLAVFSPKETALMLREGPK